MNRPRRTMAHVADRSSIFELRSGLAGNDALLGPAFPVIRPWAHGHSIEDEAGRHVSCPRRIEELLACYNALGRRRLAIFAATTAHGPAQA
jgi:hypothetical protein